MGVVGEIRQPDMLSSLAADGQGKDKQWGLFAASRSLGTTAPQVRVGDQGVKFRSMNGDHGAMAETRDCLQAIDDGEHVSYHFLNDEP
jgi:hypothetical protein